LGTQAAGSEVSLWVDGVEVAPQGEPVDGADGVLLEVAVEAGWHAVSVRWVAGDGTLVDALVGEAVEPAGAGPVEPPNVEDECGCGRAAATGQAGLANAALVFTVRRRRRKGRCPQR
jgi:hypothetical protein